MSSDAFFVGAVLGVMLWAPTAHADGDPSAKVRCESSYEAGQRLKREEHFSAARAQLAICSATCPPALVADCDKWQADLETLVPTIRLAAKRTDGAAVTDVVVTIDGQWLTSQLDGRAIPIEPGSHVFRFETRGHDHVEVRAEVHSGERDHRIEGVLSAPAPRKDDSAPSRPANTRSAVPSYVLGGLGVVALAVAGVLTIKGHVDRSELKSTCYPYCTESDVDSIRTTWLVAGISAGVGALALGAALVLWPKVALSGPAP